MLPGQGVQDGGSEEYLSTNDIIRVTLSCPLDFLLARLEESICEIRASKL